MVQKRGAAQAGAPVENDDEPVENEEAALAAFAAVISQSRYEE